MSSLVLVKKTPTISKDLMDLDANGSTLDVFTYCFL